MTKGRIWVKADRAFHEQKNLGETFMIIITDPDDSEKVLFQFGPYTVNNGDMITHELLVGCFDAL